MSIDLSSVGWDDEHADMFARVAAPHLELRPGRVCRSEPGACVVLAADGPRRVTLGGGMLTRAAADPTTMPCAGDWVVIRAWPDDRQTMEAVLPRRTQLTDGRRVFAANVDAVVLSGPLPPSERLRLEGIATAAGVEVVKPVKPFKVYGKTLAILGRGGVARARLVAGLVGTPVLNPGGLMLVPGGGAVLDGPLLPAVTQSPERARKIVVPRG
jgi:ribosome biogenesis GTPase